MPQAVLRGVTERSWQRQVIQWAKQGGWLVHHVHDSRYQEWGTDRGVPDLLLAHPYRGIVVFAELKTERGRLTRSQEQWMRALAIGIHDATRVVCWRPRDHRAVRALLVGEVQPGRKETRVELEEVTA